MKTQTRKWALDPRKKIGFTTPFDHTNHKWDGSWPNDKKAYYNARKKVQEGHKKREINESGARKNPT